MVCWGLWVGCETRLGVGQHHRQWFENNSQASSHVCCSPCVWVFVCIFKLSKYLYAFWQVQIYAKNVDEDTGKHKQSAEFKWSINCSWHFSWVEVIKHSNGRRWQTYHDKVVQFSVNFPPFPDCRRHSRQSLIEFWVPPIDLKPHGRGWWASYGWGAATKQFFGSELPLDRAQFKDFIFLVWIIAIERGKIEKIEIDLHCARCALEHSHKWLCKKLELLLFWLSVQVQARKSFCVVSIGKSDWRTNFSSSPCQSSIFLKSQIIQVQALRLSGGSESIIHALIC